MDDVKSWLQATEFRLNYVLETEKQRENYNLQKSTFF